MWGVGISVYFSLQNEPPLWLGGILLALLLLPLIAFRQFENKRLVIFICFSIASGVAIGQYHTRLLDAHPVITEEIGPVSIQGHIIDLDQREKAIRMTLDHVDIWRRDDLQLARVRINIRSLKTDIQPGDIVRVKAVLRPLTQPAWPGGYDFAVGQYFQNLSATGYSFGSPRVIQRASKSDFTTSLEGIRQRLAAHISKTFPAEAQAPMRTVLIALMTGEQDSIPAETTAELKAAGIYHIISISGLHISFVAALAFVLLRRLMALVPFLALNFPLKKIAAVCALLIVAAYTALVGAPIPTQRSALMLGLGIIGILFDRGHGPLRPVAWAALIILLIEPDAVMNVGVQLSFAAVTALLTFYENVQSPLKLWWAQLPWWQRWAEWPFFAFCSSLVATCATTPLLIYHFHEVQPYGILSNILAVPITDLWIMSSICLAYILMPFGLDGWCLHLAASGIDLLLSMVRLIASWPEALLPLPALPPASLALFGIGLPWFLIWQTRWRWFGMILIIVGLGLFVFVAKPDVILAPNGQIAMLRLSNGNYIRLSRERENYYTESWASYLQQRVIPVWNADAMQDDWLQCENNICRYQHPKVLPLNIALKNDFSHINCPPLDEGLIQLRTTIDCGNSLSLNAEMIAKSGVQTGFAQKGQWRWQTVQGSRGQRPWSIHSEF